MKKDFLINFIAGIFLGIVFATLLYIFWVGMGKEIDRREAESDYFCEVYGYCK